METGTNKTKVVANNTSDFQREVMIKGQRLEAVGKFNHLVSIISVMKDPNPRFFPGLSRQKLLCLDSGSYEPCHEKTFGLSDQVRLKPTCTASETS